MMILHYVYIMKGVGSLATMTPGTVVESVEHGPGMQKVGRLGVGPVKSLTYKIDPFHFLAWCLSLIG